MSGTGPATAAAAGSGQSAVTAPAGAAGQGGSGAVEPSFHAPRPTSSPSRLWGGTSVRDLRPLTYEPTQTATPAAPATPRAAARDLAPYELVVTPDVSEVADYDYWVAGVKLSIEGLPGYYGVTVIDYAPDGHATVIGEGQAEADGTLNLRVRHPFAPTAAQGEHRIEVTNPQGYMGTTTVKVIPWPGRAGIGTASPDRLPREELQRTPIVVRGAGFTPGEAMQAVLFDPDFNATVLSGPRPLAARSDGSFQYAFRATTGGLTPGSYRVAMIGNESGKAVEASFFLTLDSRDHRVGTLKVDTPVTTVSDMNADPQSPRAGISYALSGVPAFALLDIFLRDARGQDYFISRSRADGNGRFASSIVGSGATSGRYQVRIVNTRTQDYATVKFTVTEDDGSIPTQPTVTLSRTRTSQIDLMDPDTPVRISGTGYQPGQVVELTVKDRYHRAMSTAPVSVLVRHADADGTVRFTLQADRRPAVGTWDVTVAGWLSGSITQRTTLEVVR
ncbi:hypothetical protein [Nocardioides plantarum]|uniref:Uncharacterized protein n=1 Tax=Nocardioides plantarum TaxID=29299 RepID=A0ABV5KD15_9ACTN|nr:hypothetical protein [Nocardioides plantarum]